MYFCYDFPDVFTLILVFYYAKSLLKFMNHGMQRIWRPVAVNEKQLSNEHACYAYRQIKMVARYKNYKSNRTIRATRYQLNY